MGCSISRSEIELDIQEIWDTSEISLMGVDKYIELVSNTIKQAEIQHKDHNDEQKNTFIFQEIITKVIKSVDNENLFEKIRFHIMKDDKIKDIGHFNLYSFILFSSDRLSKKNRAFIQLHNLLEEPYKLSEIKISFNLNFFKNIIRTYIDLVSFITLGYLINVNKENNSDYLEKLETIHKCFTLKNRTQLCNELFQECDKANNFSLEQFLELKEKELYHTAIRDKMIEMVYGIEGLYKQQEQEKLEKKTKNNIVENKKVTESVEKNDEKDKKNDDQDKNGKKKNYNEKSASSFIKSKSREKVKL